MTSLRSACGDRALPRGWRWARLGELGTYVNGRAFKPDDWGSSGLPIVRIQNLNTLDAPFDRFDGEVSNRHCVEDGDLLISWSASLDAYVWNRGPAVLNQHIFKVFVDTELVTLEYLYFAVRNAMKGIRQRVQGATMQHVTKPEFEATLVPLPPLWEQARIAAHLRELVEAATCIHTAAQVQMDTAARLWKREADGHFLGNALSQYPTTLLRDITVGKGQYGTSTRSNPDEQGLPVLGMPNIGVGTIKWTPLRCVDLPDEEMSKYRLVPGDLLFNRTNSAEWVGKSAVYRDNRSAVFASYVVRLRLNDQLALPEYVCALINSTRGRRYIEAHMTRAIGQVNISAATISGLDIPLPPLAEQRRVVARLETVRSKVLRVQEAVTTIATNTRLLEVAFLRRAFCGDPSTTDSEAQCPAS